MAELVVAEGKVQEIRWDKPGTPIPPNGYVLRGQGAAAAFLLDNFQVGDPVAVYYCVDSPYAEMQLAAGGYALLVVAVEQSVGSTSLTLKEFAAFLAERLGAWRALNLDGGGSTSLAVRSLGEFKPVLVNKPARGAER
ncbi:phosphodiester glycosidase family protein [Thermodesulfitimonas sp.]